MDLTLAPMFQKIAQMETVVLEIPAKMAFVNPPTDHVMTEILALLILAPI